MSRDRKILDKILGDKYRVLCMSNEEFSKDEILLQFTPLNIKTYINANRDTGTCDHFADISKEWIEENLLDILADLGYNLKYTPIKIEKKRFIRV